MTTGADATCHRQASGGILLDGVSRRFQRRGRPDLVALEEVSMEVRPGEVVGLLGPNGAGKTTLARILTTLLTPTSGRALVAGHDVDRDPAAVQRASGVAFGGELGLYNRLSARDNLRYFATLYGLSGRTAQARVDALLDLVGLAPRGRDRVETFSRGMKQRLHLARALVHDPSVVILDEPSSGLDPAGARELRRLVGRLTEQGRTMLLATHDLREAEELCAEVAILIDGRIERRAAPRELRREAARTLGTSVEVEHHDLSRFSAIGDAPEVVRVRSGDGMLRVHTHDAPRTIALILELGSDAPPTVQVSEPTLEEAYLARVEVT